MTLFSLLRVVSKRSSRDCCIYAKCMSRQVLIKIYHNKFSYTLIEQSAALIEQMYPTGYLMELCYRLKYIYFNFYKVTACGGFMLGICFRYISDVMGELSAQVDTRSPCRSPLIHAAVSKVSCSRTQ